MKNQIIQGDALEVLKGLPGQHVHCIVTSPPYWGLRDYGVDGQLGLEETPEEYIERMVEIFCEARRVLRDDGTLWLNLGDSYFGPATHPASSQRSSNLQGGKQTQVEALKRPDKIGLPPKNLVGMPWRVAFALQADGWILRQDIIWHKPNPMPESVTDRCTKAHEYIFLLSKSERYYYDQGAIKEAVTGNAHRRKPKFPSGRDETTGEGGHGRFHKNGRGRPPKTAPSGGKIKANESFHAAVTDLVDSRNKRSVWTVPSFPYSEAHFATFPPDLIKPCVLAGCPEGGTVYDPFMGSGTTAEVAIKNGRNYLGSELSAEYIEIATRRISAAKAGIMKRDEQEIKSTGGQLSITDQ